jgi:ceramide glucosyltransferase
VPLPASDPGFAAPLAWIMAAMVALGLMQALIGVVAVWRFRARPWRSPPFLPAVTVLKPLHGDEPMLEAALASFCMQSYPNVQIVFGLQDPADSALHVVRRLRARFPRLDMTVVVDPTPHGSNRKVANLINMLPSAKHDVLVVSDSDIHAEPDYLRRVVSTLQEDGVGLVTSLYAGLPAHSGLAAQLGASQINHMFLPGVMLARGLGRQACLGATMAIRRETLTEIGGFAVVAHEVADDAILGQKVNHVGLAVKLAPTVPATTVPENDIPTLFQHELRWARTTRSLAPVGFGLSCVQYPLFWAALAVMLTGGNRWAVALFCLAWLVRGGAAFAIDRMLQLATTAPIWLLPLRDVLSVAAILFSYGSDNVSWRGHTLSVARPRLASGES